VGDKSRSNKSGTEDEFISNSAPSSETDVIAHAKSGEKGIRTHTGIKIES
jgi:hypothetical protein